MPTFSIIIPVYNRPNELKELLDSIKKQTFKDFDVTIIEDGSKITSEKLSLEYSTQFSIKYIAQTNQGPGPARNNGAFQASGSWLIFFDSDCIIPDNYLEIINKEVECTDFDCFGGPDKAHPNFNTIQKAIGYAMSSILTTGGIRGAKENLDIFYPRSFNLGVRNSVFNSLQGFSDMRFGEDLDFSMRLLKKGYSTKLLRKAFVYHKRRNNFRSFYKQVYNSGIARINLDIRHKGTMKIVHWIPAAFVLSHILILTVGIFYPFFLLSLLFIPMIILFHSFYVTKEIKTAFYSVPAAFTQTIGYGLGFIKALISRKILGKSEFHAFHQNFYK